MNLYSTAPYTDACKIVTNNVYMRRWDHPQHDEHVKEFKRWRRLGGYAEYCADFYRRRGYHFQTVAR